MARMNTKQLKEVGGKLEPTLASLIKVYSIDPGLFFSLAMDDVEESSEPWVTDLGELAHRIREMISRGFAIRKRSETDRELVGAGHQVVFDSDLEPTVTEFMRSLN